jgi:NADH dehydrogenase/NADH:ubiquinone oxidoreductase subunit G
MDGKEITSKTGKPFSMPRVKIGIDIPTICFHEATTAYGLCRICVVEVEGQSLLQPACIVPAGAGMKVQTRSERVDRARKNPGDAGVHDGPVRGA